MAPEAAVEKASETSTHKRQTGAPHFISLFPTTSLMASEPRTRPSPSCKCRRWYNSPRGGSRLHATWRCPPLMSGSSAPSPWGEAPPHCACVSPWGNRQAALRPKSQHRIRRGVQGIPAERFKGYHHGPGLCQSASRGSSPRCVSPPLSRSRAQRPPHQEWAPKSLT